MYKDRQGNIVELIGKPTDRTGAFALILFDDNVLIVKPAGNHEVWELPGGGVDDTEWLDEGLKRELYEEVEISLPSNVELRPHCKLTFQYYPDDVKQFWNYTLNLFVLKFKSKPGAFAGNEIERVDWVPFNQLNKISVNYMHMRLIQHYLSLKDIPAKKIEYDDILGYV